MGDAPTKKTKLQVLLERPPQNWVDVVIVAVAKDPYFYGGITFAVFLVLSLVALWATRELIRSIDKDERKKKKQQQQRQKETRDLGSKQQQEQSSAGDDKKTQ